MAILQVFPGISENIGLHGISEHVGSFLRECTKRFRILSRQKMDSDPAMNPQP